MKVLLSIAVSFLLCQLALTQQNDFPTCPETSCDNTVNCFIDPCMVASCPNVSEATCCSNYCGGCLATWYTADYEEEVTNRCSLNPRCPPVNSDQVGTCDHRCQGDTGCPDGQICCSNGCGTVCTDPYDMCATVRCALPLCIAGYSPVTPEGECCQVCRPILSCPTSNTLGACQNECSDENPCREGQVCCSNGCGHVCMNPVVTCFREDNSTLQVGETYTQNDCTTCTCHRNGSIVCNQTCLRQCPESATDEDVAGTCAIECSATNDCSEGEFCCVNSCGGRVCISPMVVCIRRNGEQVEAGETFDDDCNTCTCQTDGTISCTDRFCPETACPPLREEMSTDVSCPSFVATTSCTNNECPDDQLCCKVHEGCAPVCIEPVTVCMDPDGTQHHVGEIIERENSCNECTCTAAGSFNCTLFDDCLGCTDDDGDFYRVGKQFTASDGCNTCTCMAGQATTTTGPIISCTERVCPNYCEGPNGTNIAVGTDFIAYDGCNTCTCTDNGVICTLIFCVDRCFLPPNRGDDSSSEDSTRFYYDHSTGVCTRFQDVGRGDNRNSFESRLACLLACNRTSPCIQPVYREQPLCLIASRPIWTYNAVDDACQQKLDYIPCLDSEGFNVFDSEEMCDRTCISGPPDGPSCPDHVPIVVCTDPCRSNYCPNFPEARCNPNFCGGCNAWFFDEENNNVTELCGTGPTCDDGTPLAFCFRNPCEPICHNFADASCEYSECPNYPDAICEANYCGGCNAWYFDEERNVTDQCFTTGTGLPTPLQYLQCPALEEGTVGTCSEECGNNNRCPEGLLCCSNGCGRSCQMGDSIPYYPIPLQCPAVTSMDILGACVISDASCTSHEQCDDDELCCRKGCGRACTAPERSTTPCSSLGFDTIAAQGLVGAYIPQCAYDGTFAPTQCHTTGYCWCVHTLTGVPLSPSTRGVTPRCITCTENNSTYYPGQSFNSSDGCNTCFCSESGIASCTRKACEPTGCEAPSDPGPCRGSFLAYYYDSADSRCKLFTYGGCGGNDNKFSSVRDCLKKCNRESVCLLDPPRRCDHSVLRHFFNTTSDRCEQIAYGACEENTNNFESGRDCLATCDPDGEVVDGCGGILCDVPICPPGTRLTDDDSSCCPYCSELECRDNERHCANQESCVHLDQVCDVLEDCRDGSDEMNCPDPNTPTCEVGFSCLESQECIPESYVCDDYVDCRDRSDEMNCQSDLPQNTQFISFIPRECPAINDRLFDCVREESCESSSDCDGDNNLCCPTSCDQSICVEGVTIVPRCPALRRYLLSSSTGGLLGAFTPNCERDGTFSPIQCHERFCWCVDIQDGYPIMEGSTDASAPVCSGCQLRANDTSSTIPFGEAYPADDDCNVCYCTRQWPEERCTNERCPGPCQIFDTRIQHGGFYEDDCIECKCEYGSLTCSRRRCVSLAPVRQPTKVTMPFKGDLDSIASDKMKEEDLKREITRTMLVRYGDSQKLKQDQIESVELEKGSVIVIITLTDSENITSANLTILLEQLQQDFMANVLVIRFDNQVLQPSGTILVQEQTSQILPWHIAVIVVAAVAVLVAFVAIIVAVVACTRSRGSREGGLNKHVADDSGDRYEMTDNKVPLDA